MAQRRVIHSRDEAIKRACGLINRAVVLAGQFPAHAEDCMCQSQPSPYFTSEGYGAELIERLLDEYEQRINEESVTMRQADWWHGLDELDDAGNRRDDSLWDEPVVDYDFEPYERRRLAAGDGGELFDGAEDEPCWDDEVAR